VKAVRYDSSTLIGSFRKKYNFYNHKELVNNYQIRLGADGISIGDDICNWVKTEGKTPFVGKNSKKFPNGLEFGMYSNSCGNKLWDWAGRIHHEIVCCAKGLHTPCDF